ncbi:MAG: LacI family transcriptional regulator [Pseudomonadota bacterium]|nr:LacI family transcriptional regulator [Pseudomonadota bacterium]
MSIPSDPHSGPSSAPARRKAATIRDVAQAAGVSTATVSKFINGGQRFTREVEERVAQAVRDLGYSSNPMARGMITGRTGNVGIVVLDVRNPHFTSLIRGASRPAAEAGLNLLFADIAEGLAPELPTLQALSRRVDGLIVSARLSDEALAWLVASELPVVYYGGPPSAAACCSVGIDNRGAAAMLGRHLRDLGHRRVRYVGFAGARWSDDRWQGLCEAFEGSAACLARHDVRAATADEGERIASEVLLREAAPDAVVAYNDLLALGLLTQAQALGLSVPRDVSIAGFDNIVYGSYTRPGLTTVDTGSETTGEVAMRQLIAQVRGERAAAPGHEVIAARVVVRGSTAARDVVVR